LQSCHGQELESQLMPFLLCNSAANKHEHGWLTEVELQRQRNDYATPGGNGAMLVEWSMRREISY